MPSFKLYSIYEMYAVSRASYLELSNDYAAISIIVPQIKSNFTNLTKSLSRGAINKFKEVWDKNGRDFLNSLMDTISMVLKAAESTFSAQHSFLTKIFSTPRDVKVLEENMNNITIEMSRSDFLSMSVPVQSVFHNLMIIPEIPQTSVPSAIFTSERNIKKYAHTGVPVYSGVDINIVFMTPHVVVKNEIIKVLSYSSHNEIPEVRVLGRTYPKGYTSGARTIAGSMIGTLSVNDPLMRLHPEWFDGEIKKTVPFQDLFKPYLLTDQLPMFDILILFQNEYGFLSAFTIFGVKIPDHGIVMSVDDSVIEVTYQYKAMDVDVIHEIVTKEDENGKQVIDVLQNDEYILRHNMVMKGESLHRSVLDIPHLWDEIWDIYNEIDFLRDHIPASKLGLITKTPKGYRE